VKDFASWRVRRQHDLLEQRELLQHAQTVKKISSDEFDHKMKYFKLHRWDLIKHYREEMESQALVRFNIKKRARACIKLGLTYMILKEIYSKFEAHRDRVREQERREAAAAKIQHVFNKYMEKMTNPLERIMNKQIDKSIITSKTNHKDLELFEELQ